MPVQVDELIVCRFQEDVDWVKQSPIPVTIYNHGEPLNLDHPRIDVIDLANQGREAGAWLEHITRNYDHLADWSFFVQADLHLPVAELWQRLQEPYEDTMPLTTHYTPAFPNAEVKALDRVEQVGKHQHPVHWGLGSRFGERPVEVNRPWLHTLWTQYFRGPQPDPWWFGYCASYAVPKNRILERPKAFWLWIKDLVLRANDSHSQAMTTTSPWALEVCWYYLFSGKPVTLMPPTEQQMRERLKLERLKLERLKLAMQGKGRTGGKCCGK
jgi:Protein of unknown function (DUF3431)